MTATNLEAVWAASQTRQIRVSGLTTRGADVTPELALALALATLDSATVLGGLHASNPVKAAVADRIH